MLPIVSLSGPRGAQIVWSSWLNNLKQNPSFLDGLSITWQEVSKTVPTQWLLLTFGLLYKSSKPGFSIHHNFVHDFNVPRTCNEAMRFRCQWGQIKRSHLQPIGKHNYGRVLQRIEQFRCHPFFFLAISFPLCLVRLFSVQLGWINSLKMGFSLMSSNYIA